ncbi:MAG: polysaccharide biosynthesis tyrosine autokinase, partial [Prevotella sp.]|nr:polysaccharide biosynthesis tyrosine autokinase [Prevotella sp.]
MEANTQPNDPYFNEIQSNTKFSFDLMLWLYRIIKYWYLFAISLILVLGYAYIKNKSWMPVYNTSAVMMFEPRGNTSVGVAMNAVPMGSLIRNTVNQQMMLQSHDMVARTVAKLPQLRVEYFTKTRFKTDYLYGTTPIVVECNFVAPSAYAYVYKVEPIDTEKCRISYEETENTPPFSMEVPYGQFVQESRFFIKINKTERFSSSFQPFNFRFVSESELQSRYQGRIMLSQVVEGGSAVRVSVSGNNSYQDVEFLDVLLKEFQNYNLSLKNEAADNAIRFIDKQLGIIGDSLKVAEVTFSDFQTQTGMYKLETVDENRVKLNAILTELGKVRAQEGVVLTMTATISKTIRNNETIVDPALLGLDQSVGKTSLSELTVSYNTLIDKMQSLGEANPFYPEYQNKLNNVRIKILEGLKTLQSRIQSQKDELRADSMQLGRLLVVLPTQEKEYVRYDRDLKINEAFRTYLQNKKYEAQLQKASNVADNYVLEAPRPNLNPVNGGVIENTYLMCLIIGIALPLGFIICKEEVFNFSISTKEECERLSNLPVIGTIENISKKMTSGVALVKNFPKSSFAESFRNMRIRIEYLAQKEQGISMLVTSAEPADGKTFIAANVASVYQLTGKRVVLLDFDLRRPSVAKNLGIHSKKGVSNFLIGQVSLEEITTTHPDYGFDVITAGTLPPNPSELIKTKKTKDLLTYLKANYDFVVIDCSPIGLVSDAYILSRFVDCVLFVVRRYKTNKSFFKSVISQVKDDGLDRFAVVFNDVKGREGYYGTSRYYGDK